VAGDVEEQGQRHDGDRQLVRQESLIQIDREAGHEAGEPGAEQDLDRQLGSAESQPEDGEGERADRRGCDRAPADGLAGGMLLVVLRPADGEPVGKGSEDRPADRKTDDEGTQAFAPASASSTSVAWVTPVAPRGAQAVVLRK